MKTKILTTTLIILAFSQTACLTTVHTRPYDHDHYRHHKHHGHQTVQVSRPRPVYIPVRRPQPTIVTVRRY